MCVCVHVHVKGILREERGMQGGVIELENKESRTLSTLAERAEGKSRGEEDISS